MRGTASPVQVRRIRPGDGRLLKAIRLEALRTDPHAFGSTYERESDREDSEWESRAVRSAAGDTQFLAVADNGRRFVGMAGCYQPEDMPRRRELYGMWVAPISRRLGLGSRLVGNALDWAESVGATEVRLWVVDSNAAAYRLYTGQGFIETGETMPLPSNPELNEKRMIKRFGLEGEDEDSDHPDQSSDHEDGTGNP